jgi:hypothetical protein
VAAALAAGSATYAQEVRGAEVSGAFEATKVTIAPRYVCAYPVRAPFDPDLKGIAVMLSEGPVDPEAAVEALDPHTQAINQEGLDDKNYITLYVWDDGRVAMNATQSKGMVQYIDNTDMQLVAELTTRTVDEIAGRVYTEAPVELPNGESYSVDLSFATVVTRPPAGDPLDEGGGAPGEALLALSAATRRSDWPGMKPTLPDDYFDHRYCYFESGEPTEDEALECALDALPEWLTSAEHGIEILRGEVRGDVAVLEVKQNHPAGLEMLNLVEMIRTPSGWVFGRAAMVGMY